MPDKSWVTTADERGIIGITCHSNQIVHHQFHDHNAGHHHLWVTLHNESLATHHIEQAPNQR